MPTFSIIIYFNVFKNFSVRILKIKENSFLHQFCFKSTEQAFPHCIIIRGRPRGDYFYGSCFEKIRNFLVNF